MISTITVIDPVKLHSAWPFLLPGLADIQRKAKGRTAWWPEDVYACLYSRQATGYIVSIDPVKLHSAWPFLLPGLADIQRKAKGRTAWWPEDVYACLYSRQATGYTVSINHSNIGFFIVYPQGIPFSGETELFLWIMWSLPLAQRNGTDYGVVVLEVMRYLAVLALSQGHSAVGTLTVRKGLLRRYAHLWQSNVISARMERERLNELVNGVA